VSSKAAYSATAARTFRPRSTTCCQPSKKSLPSWNRRAGRGWKSAIAMRSEVCRHSMRGSNPADKTTSHRDLHQSAATLRPRSHAVRARLRQSQNGNCECNRQFLRRISTHWVPRAGNHHAEGPLYITGTACGYPYWVARVDAGGVNRFLSGRCFHFEQCILDGIADLLEVVWLADNLDRIGVVADNFVQSLFVGCGKDDPA